MAPSPVTGETAVRTNERDTKHGTRNASIAKRRPGVLPCLKRVTENTEKESGALIGGRKNPNFD